MAGDAVAKREPWDYEALGIHAIVSLLAIVGMTIQNRAARLPTQQPDNAPAGH